MTDININLVQKLDKELWSKLRIEILPVNKDLYRKLYLELWDQINQQLKNNLIFKRYITKNNNI
jgi:hypothetical protein